MRNMSLVVCKNNAILKLFEAYLKVDQYGGSSFGESDKLMALG